MFALHGWPEIELGRIATRVGPITAATYVFKVKVTGRGGHAAFPHGTRDPIAAAAAIITTAQSIVSRNIDPLKSAVISFTQFHGGTTFNIIPGEAELQGTIRALESDVERLVLERFEDLIGHIAAAYECAAELTMEEPHYPVTDNAAGAIDRLKQAVPHVETDMLPVMGGEDFAYYSEKVPSGFFAVGMRAGPERIAGLHHPKFDFNDDALRIGIKTFCQIALQEAAS
jgi:hippurate hydrolase